VKKAGRTIYLQEDRKDDLLLPRLIEVIFKMRVKSCSISYTGNELERAAKAWHFDDIGQLTLPVSYTFSLIQGSSVFVKEMAQIYPVKMGKAFPVKEGIKLPLF
jgi:hypothetical protein